MHEESPDSSNNWLPRAAVARYDEVVPLKSAAANDVLACARLIENSGPTAAFAVDEFFHADVRNPNTRRAYRKAVTQFLAFVHVDVDCLAQITPAHVGRYFDQLTISVATKKLHLSALRHFFDRMVNRHVIVLNPALSVRGERSSVMGGKTVEIPPIEARQLLESIDVSNVVGLRDRLVIALLAFTAARVGAIVKITVGDVVSAGSHPTLNMQEKRGKAREIPVRQELSDFIADYALALGSVQKNEPLLRTAVGKTRRLTSSQMSAADVRTMLKRRLKDAQLPTHYSPHSFRVMVVTNLLSQGVSLEDVRFLAGHSDPRTTRLYDRRQQKVTRNLVERISV